MIASIPSGQGGKGKAFEGKKSATAPVQVEVTVKRKSDGEKDSQVSRLIHNKGLFHLTLTAPYSPLL